MSIIKKEGNVKLTDKKMKNIQGGNTNNTSVKTNNTPGITPTSTGAAK